MQLTLSLQTSRVQCQTGQQPKNHSILYLPHTELTFYPMLYKTGMVCRMIRNQLSFYCSIPNSSTNSSQMTLEDIKPRYLDAASCAKSLVSNSSLSFSTGKSVFGMYLIVLYLKNQYFTREVILVLS